MIKDCLIDEKICNKLCLNKTHNSPIVNKLNNTNISVVAHSDGFNQGFNQVFTDIRFDRCSYYVPNQATKFKDQQIKIVDRTILDEINNYGSLNPSDCIALRMLQIFSALSQTLYSISKWQEQSVDNIDKLNDCLLALAKTLQEVVKQVELDQKNSELESIRKGGMIGALMNIGTLIVGIAICPNPLGILMIANSIFQLIGNIARMTNPESAIKQDCWQNLLAQNGIFTVFDIFFKDGGEIVQNVVMIAMIFATNGASIVSAITNRSILTTSQIIARSALFLDDITKIIGLVGNISINKKDATSSVYSESSEDIRKYFNVASIGLVALAIHTIMHTAKLDKTTTGQIIDMGLGASVGLATMSLNKLAYNHITEEKEIIINLNILRNVNYIFSVSQQVKNLSTNELRIEYALRQNTNKNYEADRETYSKSYDFYKTQAGSYVNTQNQYSNEILESQTELMELVKIIELTFMQIFANKNLTNG